MAFILANLVYAALALVGQSATVKLADLTSGDEWTHGCIKVEDFNTKTASEEIEVADADATSGCCPEGFVMPKFTSTYLGPQVACGWGDDGTIKGFTTGTTCDYGKCFIMKTGLTCLDDKALGINGCCADDQWPTDCLHYDKNSNSNGIKQEYCTRYTKQYELENTAATDDDIVDGKLKMDKLYYYTQCKGDSLDGSGGTSGDSNSASGFQITAAAMTAAVVAVIF